VPAFGGVFGNSPIISRGKAAGYMMQVPSKDKIFFTKKDIINQISILLGGQISEEIILNEITTGAASDLKEATKLALDIVVKYGMSDKIGPRVFSRIEGVENNYSEKTAVMIDAAVAAIIKEAKKNARNIVKDKIFFLKKTVEILLEKEVIERREFEALFKK